jgi:hypothetical protein
MKNEILIATTIFTAAIFQPPQEAKAQEESAEETQTESQSMSVTKQNNCEVLISNASSLNVNQKLRLTASGSQSTVAIVRRILPNGSASASLNKNVCNKTFVGAVATLSTETYLAGGQNTGNKSGALPKGVVADSSAHERIKNKTALRLGFGFMLAPGVTLAASYNTSHEMTLESTVELAGLNLLPLYKYDRLRIGALAHYFTSNSFHLSGGMVFEKFTSSSIGGKVFDVDSGGIIIDNAYSAEINQIQIQFGLGNRWNLGRFVIGSEWVGYSRPLFNISETYNRANGYPENSFAEATKNNKDFASSGSVRLLNSYIGFSF